MKTARRPFTCLECLRRLPPSATSTPAARAARPLHAAAASRLRATGAAGAAVSEALARPPPSAPRANVDIKHIRQNAALHEQNCLARNYRAQAAYPARIAALFEQWQQRQREGRAVRERSALLQRQLAGPGAGDGLPPREELLEAARGVKAELAAVEADEAALKAEMEALALAVPNLTSERTPLGDEPRVLSYINDHPEPEPAASDRVWRSHVHIGAELGLLDFAAAATASGWGWYYLVGDGARLEQALVQYALAVATRHGWRPVSPPSMVYGHIAAACGYQPRDAGGEQQVYGVAQADGDAERGRPPLCLAGTAEIPLAALKAGATLDEAGGDLPLRLVGASRCYRAEAGARGADTKGLYRVHEFTKVELFAWTRPDADEAEDVFDEVLDMQTELLQSLGLHCRVLEMPSADLGASAARKVDIEAFFPSRRDRDQGWGEVTSTSICTDYQTRRLATRSRGPGGKLAYPWTINGTAMAVPRVLAAILENGWDEAEGTVAIPEVLRPWMGGQEKIGLKHPNWDEQS